MNPEPVSQVVNPPPETPSPGLPAETGEARQEKPGLLRRFIRIGQWLDRGLDLDGRDTSDWNIYYYYFRQVAQHHAPIKLRHLKWIALLFQLYFFGMLALAQIRFLFLSDSLSGDLSNKAFKGYFTGLAPMLGVSVNIYILPVLLFVPVFMVAPAFRLRNKAQGFMTSRAKEPPLLAQEDDRKNEKGDPQTGRQAERQPPEEDMAFRRIVVEVGKEDDVLGRRDVQLHAHHVARPAIEGRLVENLLQDARQPHVRMRGSLQGRRRGL